MLSTDRERAMRTLAGLAGAMALALSPGAQAAEARTTSRHVHQPAVCSGTAAAPGVLSGSYPHGVHIRGLCEVNAGRALVRGNLTVLPGGSLLAEYALNDRTHTGGSSLQVSGSLFVEKGATAILGCEPEHFTCADDPGGHSNLTLTSTDRIGASLRGNQALGVIAHHDRVGGSIIQSGGGGGATCEGGGIFVTLGFPDYSDYEDSTVRGGLSISGLDSCWLGIARMAVGANASIVDNTLDDPDAIEILSNTITGSLTCAGNSQVWDSNDQSAGSYPRYPRPNTVRGARLGQCALASPTSEGGPAGPGPF